MKKLKMNVLILLNLLIICSNSYSQDTIFLDGKSEGRIFDGICGVNAGGGVGRLLMSYPKHQRSEILDYLFKPNFGAAVHAYKAEIGGDGNSTEGSEPSHMHTANDQNYTRGYQWWIMKEAKKRNPDIKLMALAWNFPGWINNVCSQTAADYLVNYIKGAKAVHNLEIDYIGIWNETKTCNNLAKLLRTSLDTNGLRKVKIISDDLVNTWAIADSMSVDNELYNSIDIVSTHYPRYKSTTQAKNIGKPIWSTEDGQWCTDWGGSHSQAGPLAKILNLNYVSGKMTSTHVWNIITSYYDILDLPDAGLMRAKTPWSGFYEVMSPIWIVAHTTQFAQPGWQYIDKACGMLKNGGSYVTLKKGRDYSTIIESFDAVEKKTLHFTVLNGLSAGKIHVWRTDSIHYFEKIFEIIPLNGTFSLDVEKNCIYSLTTTTGQRKGSTKPPKEKSFPLPYKDDFEKYKTGFTGVNYFSEQNGAYEVSQAGYGRTGKALSQVVSQKPISWGNYGKKANLMGTASIIGDDQWSNYSVSADILIETPGYARVMGRVSRATLGGQIDGYQLYFYDDGIWKLKYSTTQAAIDSGKAESGLKIWHNLKITFNHNAISCFIDNMKVSEVSDNRFDAGMAGIGNDYNKGLYDNFEITPIKDAAVYATDSGNKGYFFEKIPISPVIYNCIPMKKAVKIRWAAVPGARGYRIKYGTQEGEYTSVTDVGNLTYHTLWTLSSNKRYYFVVAAFNDKGESKASKMTSAVTR